MDAFLLNAIAGIASAADVSTVQLYTTLIDEGFRLIRELNVHLGLLLERDEIRDFAERIGRG